MPAFVVNMVYVRQEGFEQPWTWNDIEIIEAADLDDAKRIFRRGRGIRKLDGGEWVEIACDDSWVDEMNDYEHWDRYRIMTEEAVELESWLEAKRKDGDASVRFWQQMALVDATKGVT